MHTLNVVLLLGDTALNCLVNIFLTFPLIVWSNCLRLMLNLLGLHISANTLVSDLFLCVMDRNICHFSVDSSCMSLNLVTSATLLHTECLDKLVSLNSCGNPLSYRWPYPFLDLSSPYAPIWYVISIWWQHLDFVNQMMHSTSINRFR